MAFYRQSSNDLSMQELLNIVSWNIFVEVSQTMNVLGKSVM